MDVSNKSAYQSLIYNAIIVDSETGDDPDNKYRVQIYIPSMYPEYLDIYEDYMNSTDKTNHQNRDKFPWAQTLVKDLKNGNIVYGSFINGKNNEFIVLGLDATNPKNSESDTTSNAYNISGSGLLDLAMGIIMHNEVGLEIGQYPDGLTDANYGNINPADNGGCSIGLIQWHESNAINLLKDIKNADSNWESYWTDKELTTYLSLKNDSINYSNFGSTWTLTVNSTEYNAIYKMLVSDEGKRVQRENAGSRTETSIEKLMNTYGVTNPAIIIYCADIMNQYGNGINNSSSSTNLKGCLDYAGQCSSDSSDIMTQLDNFVSWWKSKTKNYYYRRDTTYSYIKNCYDLGKLTTGGSTDSGESGNIVSGNGQYCMPFSGSCTITATWGPGRNTGAGGYSNSAHNGVDFAMSEGTPLVACTNGRIEQKTSRSGFGTYTLLYSDDGNLIVYGHQCAHNGDSRNVNKGDIIGYSGNTGNSSGPHLHIGITNQSNGESGLYNANWSKGMNPLPFFPFFGISGDVNTKIST